MKDIIKLKALRGSSFRGLLAVALLTALTAGAMGAGLSLDQRPRDGKHVPAPVKDENQVIDNTPDSLEKARTARPVAGSSRRGNNPVLFLVGNSTMRTGTMGNGDNGQWGWGYFEGEYFDPEKITVENHALGGMSSRTFYNKLWPDVLKGVRKGDWVIIELGHNDNGPYDSGRARASIPGIGKDTLHVTIKETGEKEIVYTYGEYMRKYVRDVKAKGAHPILMSLTPRNAWEDADSTIIKRVNKTHGLWAKQIAKEMKVPFIDLNDITARKFEKFGKEKVKYHFYLDRIHTSEFGAKVNAASAAEGIRNYKGLALAKMLKPVEVDTKTAAGRQEGKPILFTIGDSTVKNEDKDDDSMWGWGSVIAEFFDPDMIVIENDAFPGRSARTFLDEGRWEKIYNKLQPGDFVLMQFGHNDAGDINTGKARAELPGSGDQGKVFHMEKTGRNQVIYPYGWYLRKFILDAKEKGAIPIVVSHTPRNIFDNGIIQSNASSFGKWAREVAEREGVLFIDLNGLTGERIQQIAREQGLDAAGRYFKKDHTHTSKLGARLNAGGVTAAIAKSDSPLAKYVKQTTVTVTNPLTVARGQEMAETDASDLLKEFPAGFIILDGACKEVPYQITYDNKLVFPVDMAASQSLQFRIVAGAPRPVKARVHGRCFPEHKDNMNWENDKSAYVAYGPALRRLNEHSYGYDIWTKSVDSLVIEDRNVLELRGISLHKDQGNGMDVYIVSSTLGGGAPAILDKDGYPVYPWTWESYRVLDNGPLRFTVELTYPYENGAAERRIITLDAGSYLNRSLVKYQGLKPGTEVAAGIVVHQQNPDGYKMDQAQGWMSYTDLTEDAAAGNGKILVGVVAPGSKMSYKPVRKEAMHAVGHILAAEPYDPATGFTYWWGSAWDKGNHPADWNAYLRQFSENVTNPLIITLSK